MSDYEGSTFTIREWDMIFLTFISLGITTWATINAEAILSLMGVLATFLGGVIVYLIQE